MEFIITFIFLSIIFLGMFLLFIYHVVKSAIKDALKDNRSETKLILREEIQNALKQYVNVSKSNE